ncbi:Phosphorylated carbohydrates phosphatase [Actinidia chinensis var. chinensis]|uniref:Phosphorylated carbohydrates phosphatase n=1 Tax=Actinidia chinensis var. chinensis TaxID=1590841 RepID=A0A2R6QNC8_ACTCC|nr:Phosphorylated carbohydrates phosphatase [Actinidia chinensis var. chinensis]
MVESIAATSLLGHRPVHGGYHSQCISSRRKVFDTCQIPVTAFIGRKVGCARLTRLGVNQLATPPIKARAMEVTKEAHSNREEEEEQRIPQDFRYQIDTAVDRKPGFWPPRNKADDPSLHNPLLRLERMGSGWLAVIFEWEGVLIEDYPDLERQAWQALSQEEGKSRLPAFLLRTIEGMKNEQAISEVLCWSRDPQEVKRMASRKEQIYQALHGGRYIFRYGSWEFLNLLTRYKIPMALVATRPRKFLEKAIRAVGIEGLFTVIVAADDVRRGKPDPEMFLYAAKLLNFIPERCIVFGNSNQTVEAAHDARMKCVAVASKHPMYELGAADLVVRRLDELSVTHLKNLAHTELSEFESPEPELQMEEEDEADRSSIEDVDDDFW